MKYLKKFEEVDRSLNKEDKSEIMSIFQSIISDDNFYEYEGTYDNNQILYKMTDNSINIYVGRNCLEEFKNIIPKIKHFIEVSEDYGYYPHILNNYQKKKRFRTELEDYTNYLIEFFKHGGNPNPLTILL
jgi:hypothetical protein